MKSKFWLGFSLFLVLIAVLQPIFAEPQMDRTVIDVYSDADHYIKNGTGDYMIFDHVEHDLIPFAAYLSYRDKECWISPLLGWRWLNFYLYTVNADGSNGKLLFHDHQKTGFYGDPIRIKPIKILPGVYRVIVTYNGNFRDHLSPCSTTKEVIILNKT